MKDKRNALPASVGNAFLFSFVGVLFEKPPAAGLQSGVSVRTYPPMARLVRDVLPIPTPPQKPFAQKGKNIIIYLCAHPINRSRDHFGNAPKAHSCQQLFVLFCQGKKDDKLGFIGVLKKRNGDAQTRRGRRPRQIKI